MTKTAEEINTEFRMIISHALLGCDLEDVSRETWELLFEECTKYALKLSQPQPLPSDINDFIEKEAAKDFKKHGFVSNETIEATIKGVFGNGFTLCYNTCVEPLKEEIRLITQAAEFGRYWKERCEQAEEKLNKNQ